MNRRNLVGTMVVVASLFASEAVYAQPAAMHVPVHAIFAKSKTISFTISNEGKETVHLMAAGTPVTVEAGKSIGLKLNAGDQVLAAEGTPNFKPGEVVVVATASIADAKIILH